MATTKYFFIFALIYTGHCNPLAQTTLCESAQNYPVGSSTVCESSPNFPYYPYGLPWGGIGGAGYLPNGLGFPGLNYAGLGSTAICENIPNVGRGLPGLGYLNSIYGLPLGLPYGLPAPLPIPVPVPAVTGSSTVCESTPNVGSPLGLPMGLGSLSLPMSLPGLGIGGLGLGGLGLNGLGLNGLGLNGLGLNGLGLNGLGLNGLGLNGLGYGLGPAAIPVL